MDNIKVTKAGTGLRRTIRDHSEFSHFHFSNILHLTKHLFIFSQNSSGGNDDGWNGFESHNSGSNASNAPSSKPRSMKVEPKTPVEDDLLSLDVKATSNKKSSGKSSAKKPEDDIWDMLNN